jgi:DNA repair protein RAD50
MEIATSDIERYHKALERALLSFHAAKMSDINKTIKELWQKTYRGVDIDYIQIKADTESTASSRSSYNYRVVMYIGGAELDMRGRCSAGQRVLSCLIIRLALAETFCLNCGILALDEPTTNLDAENTASLAESLKSLMLARRDFESFQLVVITHDEDFARRLGSREFIETIWRITKDENQHSRIIMESIS